ncbi:Baeyer-Villiger monooxygenase [Colletotrichum siamense]|uniref:Baeyer-Villiger monooxygenase n=1 Tax=Colletotrichum siamense TaxID=690259 RepID=UPI001872931B|nr:Baeyer-Villiger monooxygenase [Colletotrichum siamense]KAF5516157.1 Baeyer-Villiger monooxygenase [Colletotrichum siamense]
MNPDAEKVSYSLFSCIGTGFAAIALGAQLKRWYGIEDIQFFERHSSLGGTWFINKYPGCACDVPSALYSISFAPNPDWTKVMPSHSELWEYLDKVARDYDLVRKMAFDSPVERCEWIEDRARWRLTIRHCQSDTTYYHESQFLFAATGCLVTPREIDVPGVETFRGEVVHTGKWRPIDLEGKKVVMFGNGCTASQVVPAIVHKTKSLTQVVRTKHWIMPSLDADVPPWVRLVLKWVPAVAWLQRLMIFCVAENSFRGFRMTDGGKKFRASQRKVSEDYMRAAAPAKYHDMLIPDFEVNCKRRIFDPGYLQSIHADNFDLTDEKVVEITPDGVRTANGFIEADVLIFATGYHTNQFAAGIDVRGRGGETLESRWEALGGEGAYNTTAMSGFPNFFFLLGPNSVTGHTSTVMALENCINYALRVIKPVLKGRSTAAMIKSDAEQRYVDDIQDALQKTVWNTGCGAWYTKTSRDGTKRWNAMGYPYSQPHFWYRCLFPVWSDWQYSGRAAYASQIHNQGSGVWITAVLVAIVTLAVLGFLGRDWLRGIVPDLSAATRGSAAFVPNYL